MAINRSYLSDSIDLTLIPTDNWSQSHRQLWDRLSSIPLNAAGASFSFSKRLAKENGWSHRYSERVVEEYRRFLFLCMVADHTCCPSDQVDQAWHLHLTYTRSYWNDLCRDTLKRPLHHEATKGGPAEHKKHTALYDHTLASYQAFFGKPAPSDIWPETNFRFGKHIHFRRVNVRSHWVIPRPDTALRRLNKAVAGSVSGIALTALLVPLAAGEWNPFDLRGPQFLMLFVAMYVFGLIAALAVRRSLYLGRPGAERNELTPYEAACLAHNPTVAIGAAVCRLAHDEHLRVIPASTSGDSSENRFVAARPLDVNADAFEQSVYNAATCYDDGVTFRDLHASTLTAADQINESLRERELKPTNESHPLRLLPSAIMFTVFFFGAVKIAVGINRNRPVGFLVVLAIVALVTAFVVFRRPARTSAGTSALQQYEKKAKKLKPKVKTGNLSGEQLALAVGVYGLAMIATPHLMGIHDAWRSTFPPSTGMGGSGGCSASGCGGSGCGGGCGGGGCGGCGGD